MAVDPYAMCPCGSGKKLKFCCTDLVGDIEKIQRMIEGDQPRAALQHASQTLAQHPGRSSLLDLKAKLELMLGELSDAEATVAEFIERDPKNSAAFAQQAVVQAASQGGRAGVLPLQHALTLVTDTMPRRVLEGIGAVGQALLIEGNIFAARAHLWLYQGIAGKQDTRALDLLMRLNQSAGLPLLLRDHLYMKPLPEGHEGAPDFDRAQVFASRGMWQPAVQVLDALCGLYTSLPSLIYNRALVQGWLGDTQAFAKGMHEYAAAYPSEQDPIAWDDAVETEALAQLVDPELKDPAIDVIKLTYPVQDEVALLENLTGNRQIASYEIDPAEHTAEEGPPPRAAYLLLDKLLPESGTQITREEVPSVVGVLSHYGKQTDREERLELVLDRSDAFDSHRELLQSAAGNAVGPLLEEERIGESSAAEQVLSWRWHFPVDTPPIRRRELLSEQRRHAILHDWPAMPRAVLSGKSPTDAAQDESLRVALSAAVLLLEQGGNNQRHSDAFGELRQQLGLPTPEPIDPSDLDVEQLPIGRLTRLNFDKLSDQDLVSLYQRAAVIGARGAVATTAREIIKRPTAAELTDIDEAFVRLITEEEDTNAALQMLDEARQRSESLGKSTASWDLLELELHIVEGSPDEANRVLTHLRQEHLEEPGVAEQLYQIMYALGATPETMQAAPADQPAGVTAEPAAAAGAKIWTPGGDADAGGGQKLWTPD